VRPNSTIRFFTRARRRTEWGPIPSGLGAICSTRRHSSAVRGNVCQSQEKHSLLQPVYWDINTSFRKGFAVVGTQRFDLRIEAFNIINRARLGNAVTNPTLGTSATSRRRSANRTMQIGMQYIF
jgi:hypothetical protein